MNIKPKGFAGSLKRVVLWLDFWLPDINPVFAWYNLWVGAYWDRKERKLYLLAIPCIGFVFDWSHTTDHSSHALAGSKSA